MMNVLFGRPQRPGSVCIGSQRMMHGGQNDLNVSKWRVLGIQDVVVAGRLDDSDVWYDVYFVQNGLIHEYELLVNSTWRKMYLCRATMRIIVVLLLVESRWSWTEKDCCHDRQHQSMCWGPRMAQLGKLGVPLQLLLTVRYASYEYSTVESNIVETTLL